MCIFGSPGPPVALKSYAPPAQRVAQKQNVLPEKKDIEDVGEVKDIAYGGEQTRSNPGAGNKRGSNALTIALNTGQQGASTGGINV
tara:strand:+ start:209 stop:466 length:258 start_codon:yes stop_codon:yes gene_type:complete